MMELWQNLFKKNKIQSNIQEQLKANLLFKNLTDSELKLVESIINVRHYQPSEHVFHQNELGVGMYIICKGAVDIVAEQYTDNDKKFSFITKLKEGDFFGELALVEYDGKRSASAYAVGETVLIGFFKPALLEIIKRNPTAGVKILWNLGQVLGSRLRESTSALTDYRMNEQAHKNHAL